MKTVIQSSRSCIVSRFAGPRMSNQVKAGSRFSLFKPDITEGLNDEESSCQTVEINFAALEGISCFKPQNFNSHLPSFSLPLPLLSLSLLLLIPSSKAWLIVSSMYHPPMTLPSPMSQPFITPRDQETAALERLCLRPQPDISKAPSASSSTTLYAHLVPTTTILLQCLCAFLTIALTITLDVAAIKRMQAAPARQM